SSLSSAAANIHFLLSSVAHFGHDQKSQAELVFVKSIAPLKLESKYNNILPRDKCDIDSFERAVQALSSSTGEVKKVVIGAVVTCISLDGKITINEAEVLRAVCEILDCPLPPFVAPA